MSEPGVGAIKQKSADVYNKQLALRKLK